MLDINVKLDHFEGPVGLLYHLIEKNEIDIYDIPISDVTDQYIAIISRFPPDMESLSSFVVMAAHLLEIKSRLLLPSPKEDGPEEETDPREALVNRLLMYKRFKDISEVLKQREGCNSGVVFKEKDGQLLALLDAPEPTVSEVLDGITMERIVDAFITAINRKELKVDKIRASYGFIKREDYTISDSMEHLRGILTLRKRVSFFDIFEKTVCKAEMVATFLALLELIRVKEVLIKQEDTFDEIIITSRL